MDELLEGDISDYFIGLTKPTIDRILKTDNPADVMSLYLFYCYTAKWQKKTVVRATAEFCMKALNIGETRFSNARKVLISMKLIEDVQRKNESGKVVGWYVNVKFFFNGFSSSSTTGENHFLENPPSGQSGDKYYKTGKGNTSKTNSEIQEEEEFIPESEETIIVNDKTKTETGELFDSKALCSSSSHSASPPSPQEFLARWNSVFFGSRVLRLSPGRMKHFNARCKDPIFCQYWHEAVGLITTIPWMMGEKDGFDFEMSVDYFLRPDSLDKILEKGNTEKLPKKGAPKKKTMDDLRKEVDGGKFRTWLMKEIPSKYHEWDQFNCPDITIKEFLEQTT